MQVDARRALEAKLLAALARREYSQAELFHKFGQMFEQDLVAEVLTEYAQKGWQSDERFAEQFVRAKVERGQGRIKVEYELKQHNIAQVLCADLLDAVDWRAVADAVYQRKYDAQAMDAKERAKRQRFLLQRGFSFDDINAVINNDVNNS